MILEKKLRIIGVEKQTAAMEIHKKNGFRSLFSPNADIKMRLIRMIAITWAATVSEYLTILFGIAMTSPGFSGKQKLRT
jgi:hypothetical protein